MILQKRAWRVLLRLWAELRRWRSKPAKTIGHDAVLERLSRDGSISARYCVMTVLSCGIAILGLLQSSPAVVIGAMLISPLMSPMILFGFSFAVLDYHLTLRSLKAIGLGIALSLFTSALIVWLSPLTSATPEILARTHPNFFDLLVAFLSAVAGAYAVAHHEGETIVGVAIATALMPPLAVTGYGIAVGNAAIGAGAAGLFMTNLLAIALTASLVARFFGFAAHQSAHIGRWQILGITAVFAVLSIPLGFSLHQIAQETLLTAKARSIIAEAVPPHTGRLYGMDIKFSRHGPFSRPGPVQIDALILTQAPRPGLENRLQHRLETALGQPVQLLLSQAPVHTQETLGRQDVENLVHQSAAQLLARETRPDMAAEIAAAAPIDRMAVSVDPAAKQAMIRLGALTPARLHAIRTAAATLAQRHPDWRFTFRCDPAGLPEVAFAERSSNLDAAGQVLAGDIAWALRQTTDSGTRVRVLGRADGSGSHAANRRLARKRAEAVATILRQAGMTAAADADYPVADQARLERERGRAALRTARVIVRPGT